MFSQMESIPKKKFVSEEYPEPEILNVFQNRIHSKKPCVLKIFGSILQNYMLFKSEYMWNLYCFPMTILFYNDNFHFLLPFPHPFLTSADAFSSSLFSDVLVSVPRHTLYVEFEVSVEEASIEAKSDCESIKQKIEGGSRCSPETILVRFCNLIDWSLYGRDFVHTCLWHGPLNSTRCLFVYGRAVQVLLTVQYTRTHIM